MCATMEEILRENGDNVDEIKNNIENGPKPKDLGAAANKQNPEKTDNKKTPLQEKIENKFSELFLSEEIKEKINGSIVSENNIKKAYEILNAIKKELLAQNFKWKDDEMEKKIRGFVRQKLELFDQKGMKTFFNIMGKAIGTGAQQEEPKDQQIADQIKKYEGYYYKPNSNKHIMVWYDSKKGAFRVSGKQDQDFTPQELDKLLEDYPEKKSVKDKPKDPMAVFIAGAQNFVKLRLDQIKELKGKDLEEAKLETFTFSDSEEYVQIKNENDPAKKKKMLAAILKGDEEIKKAFEERKKSQPGQVSPKPVAGPDIPKQRPTQKDADAFEMSSQTNGSVYKWESIPDDARDEQQKIKNLKVMGKVEQAVVDNNEERDKRQDNLLSLEKNLDNARMNLVKTDLKKGQLWKRLANILNIKRPVGERLGEDEEVVDKKNIYQEALKEYQSAFLDEAKRGNITEKELGYILEYFSKDEKIKLYDTRTEARLESNKGTRGEWIKNKKDGLINWYIKLKPSTKIALAVGLTAAAGGASVLGATVAGTFAVAAGARSVLAGGAMSVTTETFLEGLAKGHRDRKSNKEVEKYLNDTEKLSDEERVEKLKELLNKDVSKVTTDLQKRKIGSLFRKTGAIFAGTAVGALSMVGIAEKFGFGSHWIAEKLHLAGSHGAEHISSAHETGAAVTGHESLQNLNTGNVTIDHKLPVSDLLVHKGSSLEGTLIEHFKSAGMSAHEAAQRAHVMAIEYANTHPVDGSLIHEGAKIHLGLSDTKIESITGDSHLGNLHHAAAHHVGPQVGGHDGIHVNNLENNPNAPHLEGNYSLRDHLNAPSHGTTPPVENNFNVRNTVFEKNMDGIINSLKDQANHINHDLGNPLPVGDKIFSGHNPIQDLNGLHTHNAEDVNRMIARLGDLQGSGKFLSKFNNAVLTGRSGNASKEFLGVITKAIKNGDNDRLASVMTYVKELLGNQAKRNTGEALAHWSKRVADLAIKATTKQ